ncbi:MAG: TolC family outer membrane protein [Roseinatronobacter sp.]
MIRTLKPVVLAVALSTFTVPAYAQTLADSLVAAYRNSNLLDQQRAVLRAADEDVALALARLRPVVDFVVNAQQRLASGGADSTTLGATLQAGVTLIDFGRGQLGREAANAAVLATRHALVGVEQNVLFQAVAAHQDVRTATEAVALQQATLRAIDQELAAARERFELGEVTRTDVSLAEARLAAARSFLAAAEGDLAIARETYRLATGTAPGQLRPLPALPRTAPSLQVAQDIARRTHPAILEAQQNLTASELQAEIALAARHGSVRGTASIGRQFGAQGAQNPNTTATAGVSYERPIFQGGTISAQHRQALARRDAARAGLQQTVAQVIQNVGAAWANVEVSGVRITASQQQVRASESAFEGTREEARLGARTTLDVLNAETDLLDARTQLLQAQAGLQLATYDLLSAMGLLTVDHLGLGIPTYDVEAYFNAVRTAPITSPQGEALDRVLRAIGRP